MKRYGKIDEETGEFFFLDIYRTDNPEDMQVLSESLHDEEITVEEYGSEEVRVRVPIHLFQN